MADDKPRNVLVRLSAEEFAVVEKAAAGNKQRFCRSAILSAAGAPPVPELSPRRADAVVAQGP